jgi:hypothetical protein
MSSEVCNVISRFVIVGRIDMKTTKSHGIKNAVLVVLLLLGFGTLANMYLNNRIIAGLVSYGISQRIAEIPVFSFLPRWFLNKAAIPISREQNAGVLKSAFEVFDPSLRSFLTSVPIILDSSANTAKSYPAKGYIGVSPDWDNTVLQSPFMEIYEQRGMKPEDPVFIPRFKTNLLIHEFLHILQVHQGIDSRSCYEAVARWYLDPRYGIPSPNGVVRADTTNDKRPDSLASNRIKYVVWHQLYNYRRLQDVPQDGSWKNMQYVERYQSAERGVEEFAYIGEEILASGSSSENYIKTGQWCDKDWKDKKMRLLEVSPEVIALYRGIFNPEVTQ